MNFAWLRLAAIHYISTDGFWSVCGSNELFTTDPLDAAILWHDAALISKSESLALLKLGEM
jgi:hypothetical protein